MIVQSLQDAVYNWLSIQLVADDRPEDQSAQETAQFFKKLLTEEHKVKNIEVKKEEDLYFVTCTKEDEERKLRFPSELIELINDQIRKEPHKFKNYND